MNELQIALTLCLSPGQQSIDYQGVVWEFYPPDTVKLIGTDGRRLTIVTLRMPCSEQSRFRMTVEDCREVLSLTDPAIVPVWGDDSMMVYTNDRAHVAQHDPREYPPAASQLHRGYGGTSSYDLMDLTTAVSECHMVSNGTVHLDLLTYRGLLIEPMLREDLRVICRVQMALHGRQPV